MSIETLKEKAKTYSISQEHLDSKEKGRLEFVTKFPIDKIFELSLDQYVLGTDKESFCYWLEFKKIEDKVILFGVGGGNASKFGLYKSKDGSYQIGFGEKKKALNGKELEDYFSSIKNTIILALKYVSENRISEIKKMNIPFGNMIMQKILSIYYPDKFITIGASTVLIDFAKDINLQNVELTPNNLIEINYECKNAIDKLIEFKNWHYEKVGTFIWENYRPIDEEKGSNDSLKYWLYAPGKNAELWDEFFDKGIMGLGWDKLGDLNNYSSKEELNEKLQEIEKTSSSKKNDATANFEFKEIISIGDIIIAKKGRGELLGYGIVSSDYFYDNERSYFQKCRKVEWKKKGNWKTEHSLALKTLTDITKYPSEHPDYETYYERLLGIMEQTKIKQSENMTYPLNSILFGPPGTGKTYNTVLKAAEIIENRKIDKYSEALEIFKANLHDQIEFITFHQNYSYEDFIQGLRPDTENDKQLTFERKDGIFKVISDRALKNISASEQPPVAKKTFEETFNKFVNPLVEGEIEEIEVRMKKVSYFITAITNKSIEFRKTSGGTEHTLSISTLRKMYDAESVLDIQGLSSYYSPLLDELLKIGKDSSGKKEIVHRKNYVIIIDEINRANISRVFGELITLIEPDKRSHGTIPLEARLPSGDPFIVPSNLFIIGTMNTADKSIALLDIALRRRFEFESMYPKYEIEGQEIYDVEILQKINEQIIKSKGHDFQIGHAYFMGENNDLVQRMNKKVIPLLLEYYMNDEKEVKGILQSSGLKIEENSWPLRITGTND